MPTGNAAFKLGIFMKYFEQNHYSKNVRIVANLTKLIKFYPPEIIRKPMVFWLFRENRINLLKCV